MKKQVSTILAALMSTFIFFTNINVSETVKAASATVPNAFDKEIKYGDIVHNNTVVILIKFKGQPDSIYSDSAINTIKGAYVNDKKNYKDFLSEMSNGKFTTNVYFPFDKEYSSDKITPFIYEDEHPMEYYLPYSSKNPIGYKTDDDVRQRLLIYKRAFAAIKDRIPKDVDLDTDKDGYFDNVHFIMPDDPQRTLFTWSTISAIYDADNITEINGAKLNCFEVLTLPQIKKSKYGVVTHECMHLHYYFSDMYTSNRSPIKDCCDGWTLMSKDAAFPTVYERMIYSKWVDEKAIPVISKNDTYNLENSTKDASQNTIAYRINIPNSREYFMVEYRDKNASVYENDIPSSGILVYRVNADRIYDGNVYDKPELVVLKNDGLTTSQAALNGQDNRKELSLTLESGEDTGYKIQYVSSGDGKASFKLVNNNIPTISVNSSSGSNLILGQTTDLNLSADGINPGFKYTVSVNDNVILDNSSSNTVSWKPERIGEYKVKATVTDSKGYQNETETTINVNLFPLEDGKNKAVIYLKDKDITSLNYKFTDGISTLNADTILDNTIDGYNYRAEIDLRNHNVAYVCLNDFETLKVSNGYYTYDNSKLTRIKSNEKLYISKLKSNLEYSKVNENFVVSADTLNNNAAVKYKFTATNTETNETILLQDFSENSTCNVSLKTAGKYKINVEAMDDSCRVIRSLDHTVIEKENKVVIYYKGCKNPYMAYKIGDKLWSAYPGIKLQKCNDLKGYTHKVEIELGDEKSLNAIFNNGNIGFNIDSLKEYTFKAGTYTYWNGRIKAINN